ncbi:MAG TPA: hypothetical protein PLZ57_07105 [Pseudobdellovibrionaceae bacterium]|nr:hypothetical protein [Pseudobdellovibrionaceae bacterium]
MKSVLLLVSTAITFISISASMAGPASKSVTPPSAAKEDHDEASEKHDHDHDHESESEHEHEHEGEEEENASVGPEKGILIAEEKNGFKLAPEAEATFGLKRMTIATGSMAFAIPKTAIVTAGTETNVFRYRAGFYKRIDFEVVSKSQTTLMIRSKELAPGDQIVTSGLGFLRVAEITAFGGGAHGHSH